MCHSLGRDGDVCGVGFSSSFEVICEWKLIYKLYQLCKAAKNGEAEKGHEKEPEYHEGKQT